MSAEADFYRRVPMDKAAIAAITGDAITKGNAMARVAKAS